MRRPGCAPSFCDRSCRALDSGTPAAARRSSQYGSHSNWSRRPATNAGTPFRPRGCGACAKVGSRSANSRTCVDELRCLHYSVKCRKIPFLLPESDISQDTRHGILRCNSTIRIRRILCLLRWSVAANPSRTSGPKGSRRPRGKILPYWRHFGAFSARFIFRAGGTAPHSPLHELSSSERRRAPRNYCWSKETALKTFLIQSRELHLIQNAYRRTQPKAFARYAPRRRCRCLSRSGALYSKIGSERIRSAHALRELASSLKLLKHAELKISKNESLEYPHCFRKITVEIFKIV